MYDATPIEPDYSSGFGPQTPGTQPGIHADSLWRVLDEINEIDDGLILVDGNGLIQHANHLARHELARGQFLCLVQTGDQARAAAHGAPQGQLQALDQLPEEVNAQLLRGIQGATQGLRQMLTLRRDGESLPVACVPLFQRFEGQAASVLVMLGRQSATPNLALTFFCPRAQPEPSRRMPASRAVQRPGNSRHCGRPRRGRVHHPHPNTLVARENAMP